MLVALTGAQGFLGKHATAALMAAGHRVRRLTRNPTGPDDRRFVLGEPAPGALDGVDALIHNAHDFTPVGRENLRRVNVEGSFWLLHEAKIAGVKKVVFVSSISAFPGCASEYGRQKLEVEARVLAEGGVVVRPGLTAGDSGMFAALQKLCRLPVLPVFDGGRQPLRLALVHEVARDMAASVGWDPNAAGGPVTLAHPAPVLFRDLLRAMGARTLVPFPSALALAPLRLLEKVGLPLRFRSDSLVSLLNPPTSIDWSPQERLGLRYTPFMSALLAFLLLAGSASAADARLEFEVKQRAGTRRFAVSVPPGGAFSAENTAVQGRYEETADGGVLKELGIRFVVPFRGCPPKTEGCLDMLSLETSLALRPGEAVHALDCGPYSVKVTLAGAKARNRPSKGGNWRRTLLAAPSYPACRLLGLPDALPSTLEVAHNLQREGLLFLTADVKLRDKGVLVDYTFRRERFSDSSALRYAYQNGAPVRQFDFVRKTIRVAVGAKTVISQRPEVATLAVDKAP